MNKYKIITWIAILGGIFILAGVMFKCIIS
ncbi:putative membrane protein [Virgibacillus campisalis]|uniref:Membrane protein n=1 Tax=Virgibacillus alimentarius TaxID=698769 RepID=A0ABS4S8W1_9BACI|nr:putative membrane protein [Virgibacillus alimentarius]